jgi:hypothetical protein
MLTQRFPNIIKNRPGIFPVELNKSKDALEFDSHNMAK